MGVKKNGSNSKSGKSVKKSAKKSKRDLASFAAGVISAGAAIAADKAEGGTKKQKAAIKIVSALLVVAVLFCGTLYYLDRSPFDFSIPYFESFKYYAHEQYDYEVEPSNAGAFSDGELRIHYIDVGQGDCIFIQFPDGKTMLIDGGKNSSVLADGVKEYIYSLYPDDEIVTVDYCMLTHCDSDHCGSLDDVIASEKINVLCVYQPMVYSDYEFDPLAEEYPDGNYATISTDVYENFVKAVCDENAEIRYNLQGESISGDGWKINIYNPTEQMYAKLGTSQEKNNISPIMLLTCGEIDILFTGDADKAAEQNFLINVQNDLFSDGFDGDVDVLKVAHHGGEQSTSEDFLAVVMPEYAIISVGAANSYGHPSDAAIARLGDIGAAVYRTDINGNIVLTVYGENLSIGVAKTALNIAVKFLLYAK